jgi:hypothetical protein
MTHHKPIDVRYLGLCCHSMPFQNSLYLDGLPFASTSRPKPPSIQSLSYPVQCLNAGPFDLEDHGQDVGGELVSLNHSGLPGASLGNVDVRTIAKLDAAALDRRQGCQGPLGYHLALVLGHG